MAHRAMLNIDGLSINATAEQLKMHPETVRRLVREGKIQALGRKAGIGHPIVISQDEVDRILREGIDYGKA